MARILVVDDDSDFRVALAAMLSDSGHTVTTAADGLEGAQRFRAQPTDLLLVDMMMPHGGLMAIRVLREQFPGLPVIAMTGGAPFRLGFARDLGAGATLVKPFTVEQLADAIAAALAAPPGKKPEKE